MNSDSAYKGYADNNANGNVFGGGGAELDLGASDDSVWKGSSQHAPTQVESFGLSALSGPSPMMAKGAQQTGITMQAMAMPLSNLGALDTEPVSFMAPMGGLTKKPQNEVMPTMDDNVEFEDFAEFKQDVAFFVPSKCSAPSGLQRTPLYYNEMTSIVVDESPKEVLDKLSGILTAYSNDIEVNVDAANFIISGHVYIRNLAVFFKITVWDDGSNRSRLECRRTKGDAVGFTEFWNQMESKIYSQFEGAAGDGMEFSDGDAFSDDGGDPLQLGPLPALDYNLRLSLDGVDDAEEAVPSGLTPRHLGDFVQEMEASDASAVYSIAVLIDALHASTASMLLENVAFLKCVIESALTHRDTALVRGALVVLERLCADSECGADTLVGHGVLDRVIPLLNHEVDLIRKYAVRLLGKLCSAESWTLENQKLKHFAKRSMSDCRAKWADSQFVANGFIQTQMFEDITKKLVTAN